MAQQNAIAIGATRDEIQRALGEPKSAAARSDGTRVETRLLWEADPAFTKRQAEWDKIFGRAPAVKVFLVFLAPSPEKRFPWTFVYGADDRLRFFYKVDAAPFARFDAARRPLAKLQGERLEKDDCPTWTACLTSYVDELRRLAAFAQYTLSQEDEHNLRGLLDLAAEIDAGKLPKAGALRGLEPVYRRDVLTALIARETDFKPERYYRDVYRILARETDFSPEQRGRYRRELYREWRGLFELPACRRLSVCIASYEKEYRQQGYTLEDEEIFRGLRRVAKEVDDGRITIKDALEALDAPALRLFSNGRSWPRL